MQEQQQSMHIFVKTFTHDFAFDVEASDTIDNFKAMVADEVDIPPDQQKLIYESRELKDGKLSDYNIQNAGTVHCVYQLRGGGADPRKDRVNKLNKLKAKLKQCGCVNGLGAIEVATPPSKQDRSRWDKFWATLPRIVEDTIGQMSEDSQQQIKEAIQEIQEITNTIEARLIRRVAKCYVSNTV